MIAKVLKEVRGIIILSTNNCSTLTTYWMVLMFLYYLSYLIGSQTKVNPCFTLCVLLSTRFITSDRASDKEGDAIVDLPCARIDY